MNKWQDKWFYYKAISALLILAGLLAVYLYHMISQTWIRNIDYSFSYVLFQGQFLSFFTFQSNFIIGVWFLVAAIFHSKKNRFIENQNISLAISAYISVTCFIYTTILFPGLLIKGNAKIEDLITGPFFHMLTPVLFLIYTLIHVKSMSITAKKYYTKNFFFYWIYPWFYTIYLIARIILYTNDPKFKDLPFEIVYPYLAIFKETGNWGTDFGNAILAFYLIFVFFIIVHLLFIFFNLIYFFSFKRIAKKK